VKRIEWNKDKDKILIEGRKISFKLVAEIITNNDIVSVIKHPNQEKYPNQRMFLINIKNYIYMIPFVEDEEKIFLKTIIPSRKYTRDYLNKNKK
jgi:hypothetical protein